MNIQNLIKEDPMDKYSKPIETVPYKLGTLFKIEPRRNPLKPGRELVVNYDKRFPMVPGFEVNYTYYVRFFEKGNWAGNHYHIKKQEIFILISGSVTVLLEDTETKEKEVLTLNQDDYSFFYVKPNIAHKVVANIEGSVLLVLATSANIDGDEYEYNIN